MITTLAAFAHLRKLVIWLCCSPNRRSREELFNAFGNMVRGMSSLKSLRTLCNPSIGFWECLGNNNVTSRSLRELEIHVTLAGDAVGRLEAMVQGLQTFAPNLTTLVLCDTLVDLCSSREEDTIRALAELRHHPTLAKIKFNSVVLATRKPEQKALRLRLQQELGNKVQAVISK